MAFDNFTKANPSLTKPATKDTGPFANFKSVNPHVDVPLLTPPTPVPEPTPVLDKPAKTSSFLDVAKKVGAKVESTTYNLGQYDQQPDYKPNLFKDTLKEIGSLEHLPLGVGDIISQARKDPETVANLAPRDVWEGVKKTAKDTIKYPADALATIAGGLLFPVLKERGAIRFNIPGLGEVSNIQAQAADRVAAGENPYMVAVSSVPGAIFDTLFVLGMAQKGFGPRPQVIKTGDITDLSANKGSMIPKAKSFRLYDEPSTATPLPPGALEKLAAEKGFQLGPEYNSELPTYFRVKGTPEGRVIGDVVQIKPSFFEEFMGKLKGDATKVPPEQTVSLYQQQTSLAQIANAKPSAQAPIVPMEGVTPRANPEIAPTLSANEIAPVEAPVKPMGMVETLKSLEAQPGAVKAPDGQGGEIISINPSTVAQSPTDEIPLAVQEKADADWEANFAEKVQGLNESYSKLAQELKTAPKEAHVDLKERMSKIAADIMKIEDNFVAKYSQEIKDTSPAKKSPKSAKSEQFFSHNSDNKFVEVTNAKMVEITPEAETFIHKVGNGWVITEAQTGMRIADGKTQKAAIASAKELITSQIEKGVDLKKHIKSVVKKTGLSPRYKKVKTPSGSAMAKQKPKDLPKLSGELGGIDKIKAVQMPELVRLTRELMGNFPTVVKKTGNAAGRFYGEGSGRIKLIASLFEKDAQDVSQASRVLAHEIGHLIDYLPDQTLERGNLLGRLQSLSKFVSSTFSNLEGKALDLKAIRSEALKEVLAEHGVSFGDYIKNKAVREQLKKEMDALYKEKVAETGAIHNPVVRKELLAVTQYWHPYDPAKVPASFKAYRESSKELYADALSMLFNDPGKLESMAPTFYKAFFEGLDTKPDVKAAFFGLQELLNGTPEELFRARMEDIKKGFERAEAIQAGFRAKKKLADRSLWEKLRQQLDDANYPILKKQKQAEEAGKIFADSENPKFLLEEQSLADNENFLLVEKIQNQITEPLKKAGVSLEDMGAYLLLDRIRTGRAEIANPYGFDVTTASEQMKHLEETLGDKNFKLLKEKVKEFHELVFPSVEEAVRVGSYNRETFENTILPNKENYAAFQVVDYMQDHMPATIRAQVGTLKEVANPFVSTILKTVALNRLNAYQRAKNGTIKMLQTQFPGEIEESRRITTDGKLAIYKVAPGKGGLEVLEDGKMQSYDVDPYIAESFNHSKAGDLNVIVELLDTFNNKMFKPIVTTFNLGFAIYSNPIRDIKRNYKMIPNATVRNVLTEYVRALPAAVKYSKGEMTEFTKSLIESKAINAPMTDYNFDPIDTEFAAILERYGLVRSSKEWDNPTAEKVRKALVKPVIRLLEGIRFIANTFEVVSKIAGAQIRIQGGESGAELAYNIRNFTGTPNFRNKGTQTRTTNAIFVFSNIIKEGLKSDFRIATDPKTRSGYWWKTTKVDIMPKLFMFLAAAGVLGKELKDLMDKATEYDKTNYVIVPLGETDSGKAVYLRIPHDESGRLAAAVFWKMMNFAKDGGSVKDTQDIFALGAGQFPSVTPAVDLASGWAQFLAGKNPYDSFKGKNVIDDTTFQAGGGAALKKMVQWTISDLGLAKFSTYDSSTKTSLETFMEVAPLVSTAIKITDYGLQEKYKSVGNEQKTKEAQATLRETASIQKYAKLYTEDKTKAAEYAKQVVVDTLGHVPQTTEEGTKAKAIITKFARTLIAGDSTSPEEAVLRGATSNAQKAEILKAIQADTEPADFKEMLKTFLQDKTISTDALQGLDLSEIISKTESSKKLSLLDRVLGVKRAEASTDFGVALNDLHFSENGLPYVKQGGSTTTIDKVKVTPVESTPITKITMTDPRPGFSRTITDPKKLAVADRIRAVSDAVAPQYTNYLIRLAEYEGKLTPTQRNTNKDGSIDRGVFQINSKAFPQITDEQAHDVEFATMWALSLINAGKQDKWVADRHIKGKVKAKIE